MSQLREIAVRAPFAGGQRERPAQGSLPIGGVEKVSQMREITCIRLRDEEKIKDKG